MGKSWRLFSRPFTYLKAPPLRCCQRSTSTQSFYLRLWVEKIFKEIHQLNRPVKRGHLPLLATWYHIWYIQGSVFPMHSFWIFFFFGIREWLRFVIFVFSSKACNNWLFSPVIYNTEATGRLSLVSMRSL